MDFINEKIRVATENLQRLIVIEKTDIDFEYAECHEYKKTNTPPEKGSKWKPFI